MIEYVKNLDIKEPLNVHIKRINDFKQTEADREEWGKGFEELNKKYPADFLITTEGRRHIEAFDYQFRRDCIALEYKYNYRVYPMGFIRTVKHESGIWYETFTLCCPQGHNRSYGGFTQQEVIDDIKDFYKDNEEAIDKIEEIISWYRVNNHEIIGQV
jgi:hypothetical protein